MEHLGDTTALSMLGREVAHSVYIGVPPRSWTTGELAHVMAGAGKASLKSMGQQQKGQELGPLATGGLFLLRTPRVFSRALPLMGMTTPFLTVTSFKVG